MTILYIPDSSDWSSLPVGLGAAILVFVPIVWWLWRQDR